MTDTTPAEVTEGRLPAPDGVKMTRETLCAAQSAILASRFDAGRQPEHVERLQRLIDACDAHRPLGPNGKHRDRHTATCGCTDCPTPPVPAAEDDAVERAVAGDPLGLPARLPAPVAGDFPLGERQHRLSGHP